MTLRADDDSLVVENKKMSEKFLTSLFYNVADGRLVADVYLTPDEKDADYKIVITRGSGIYEDLVGKYTYCKGYDDVIYIFRGIINERKAMAR